MSDQLYGSQQHYLPVNTCLWVVGKGRYGRTRMQTQTF